MPTPYLITIWTIANVEVRVPLRFVSAAAATDYVYGLMERPWHGIQAFCVAPE